jgi:hypothetical protein
VIEHTEAKASRAIAAYAAHEVKAAQWEVSKLAKVAAYDAYITAKAAYNAAEIAYHSAQSKARGQARADYRSTEAALIKAAQAFHDACTVANGIDKTDSVLSSMRKGKG